MKKILAVLFIVSLVTCSCDKNSNGNEAETASSGDKVTRIDVRSYYDSEESFDKILCFSYDKTGNVNSFSVLYPSDTDPAGRITEGYMYSMESSPSSLVLEIDYRMLKYDGINDDYAVDVETYQDVADNFEVIEGRVSSVEEYSGTFFSFYPLQYGYDDNGYLISKTDENDDYNSLSLEWNEGNVIKYRQAESNSLIVDFQYTDHAAPAELGNFLTDFIINRLSSFTSPYVFFTGNGSKNLPSYVSFRTSDSEYSLNIEFEYEFSDGKVSLMTCTLDESSYVYTYVLKFYYDIQNVDNFEWVPII